MIYGFKADRLVRIERMYSVYRRTVWQVADPSNIMLLVTEGKCKIELAGQSAVVSEGDAVFIPAGQIYRRSSVDDAFCRMTYVHFKTENDVMELENDEAARLISQGVSKADEQLLDGQKTFVAPDPIIYLSFINTSLKKETLDFCQELQKNSKEYRYDNSLYITFVFCRFLSLISRELRRSILSGDIDKELVKVPKKLKKAIWYIKQNESSKIDLDELCTFCNVSKSQMIRYFKDTFQKTPIQYVNEYKINRAREMLQSSPELAIKNVCDALGFDDQHYFSRLFSKITGETPSAYKYRVVNFGKPSNT